MSDNMVSSVSALRKKQTLRPVQAISRGFQRPDMSRFGMMGVVCIVAMFYLLSLSFAASAASLVGKMAPGISYYYEYFDPGQRPWKPGGNLNIEEVFKNYQYYEIVLDDDGKEITVDQYIQGNKAGSEKYLVLPDGSLQKK
ncbi:MAG: hypothetical protein WAW10_00995 [Gallionella sp.]